MLEVTNAGLDDIPVIQDLTYRIWPDAYKDILSQEQLQYMLDLIYSTDALRHQINDSGHKFLILEEDQTPKGFASYSQLREPGKFRLHKLYVLPDQQGKGLGKFLLNQIIDRIKPSGATQLELNVNRYNKAKDFYVKLGFVIDREENINIGNGYFMNDYLMVKYFS
jgi:GNAT superfamily N-acetyltransferase